MRFHSSREFKFQYSLVFLAEKKEILSRTEETDYWSTKARKKETEHRQREESPRLHSLFILNSMAYRLTIEWIKILFSLFSLAKKKEILSIQDWINFFFLIFNKDMSHLLGHKLNLTFPYHLLRVQLDFRRSKVYRIRSQGTTVELIGPAAFSIENENCKEKPVLLYLCNFFLDFRWRVISVFPSFRSGAL